MGDSPKTMSRGIEVLIKKASVDPGFREVLLEKRAAAATEIDLELSAAEIAILNSLPRPQIEQIIGCTTVPDEHRRVFLGKIAAAMLALIALPLPTSAWGNQPELPPDWFLRQVPPTGSRPDLPPESWRPMKSRPINTVVVPPLYERLKVDIADLGVNTVTVKVNYDCPFDAGEIMIICGRGRDQPGVAVTCQPERAAASKGAGQALFSVEGRAGATKGMIVRLQSTTKQCEETLSEYVTPAELEVALPGFQPAEYVVESCAIYKVVEFHKVWPS